MSGLGFRLVLAEIERVLQGSVPVESAWIWGFLGSEAWAFGAEVFWVGFMEVSWWKGALKLKP